MNRVRKHADVLAPTSWGRCASVADDLRDGRQLRESDVTSWDLKIAYYAAKRTRSQGSPHGGHVAPDSKKTGRAARGRTHRGSAESTPVNPSD